MPAIRVIEVNYNRRIFLASVSTTATALAAIGRSAATSRRNMRSELRRFQFARVDVFTSIRLEGNPLVVFTDARGLSDSEMQALAREMNLQETTFVLPRDPSTEREHGVKVRIFVPTQEIPFGGHPALGTAMVLCNRHRLHSGWAPPAEQRAAEVSLDLSVGKIDVAFRQDSSRNVFGEMRQVDPVFGPVHDRETVAKVLDLSASDIDSGRPIQTISTGLPFAIVPLKQLSTLRSLRPDLRKVYAYLDRQNPKCDFYYVSLDTEDTKVGLRARSIYPNREDPATGAAAGCAAAWMLRYGITQPRQRVTILQGVEISRPSRMLASATMDGNRITDVRVGGNAVEIATGEVVL